MGGDPRYLRADHSEASVRRHVDVNLTRVAGVPSHIAMDTSFRDIYVADTGGKRVIRIDADSGQRLRDARTEYPIYSLIDIKFDYSIWSCTAQETFLDSEALAGTADASNFVPSGIAVTVDFVYVVNYATGHIIAVDKYSGTVVDVIDTGRPGAVGGIEIAPTGVHAAEGYEGILLFTDMLKNEIVSVNIKTGSIDTCPATNGAETRPRRPFPSPPTCPAPSQDTSLDAAVDHNPGYMNLAIPRDYGANTSIPCHDSSGRPNFNLDALLMAGHT